jgi:hypothetical protein
MPTVGDGLSALQSEIRVDPVLDAPMKDQTNKMSI